jgi:hypothetical protein
MNVVTAMLESFRDAADYNSHEIAAPKVILWPDEERLWSQSIELLRANYPLLWTLGDYAPAKATGPSAWLRYQLETEAGADVPVIYLPGVGRYAFRSADHCPPELRHLYALQFQGQFWTQKSGKDWTPFAFLSGSGGGLALDVSADRDTKNAIQECLPTLLSLEVEALKGKRLEAADFRAIVDDDPANTVLRWMGEPSRVQKELESLGSRWKTFRATCKADYQFDPQKDGAITAAEKLTGGRSAWLAVWKRYKQVPKAYPGVKILLGSLSSSSLFDAPNEYRPQSNRSEEERLEVDLLALSELSANEAPSKLKSLAAEHGGRAKWVWADLGESPLALIIGHLSELTDLVQSVGNLSSWEALAEYYSSNGWRADRNVLRILDGARTTGSWKAVSVAIRAVYLPWLEKLAALTQALTSDYPNSGPKACRILAVEQGTVYLFADGLRMDLAKSLEENLRASMASLNIELAYEWSALPTVTATAKPAWMPLASRLGGPLDGPAFQPKELSSGKALVHARFKQLVTELGISCLDSEEVGDPIGCCWTEFGSVDTYGHAQQARLAWRVEEELTRLQQRIAHLLSAGWTKVKLITDHGWLVMPGGLPKAELPKHLAESRWSRCAVPEPNAQHGYAVTPWFWDGVESVVLAPGIACFVAGMEYAHGGLTLQEALIPSLTITSTTLSKATVILLKEIKWSGLRLNLILEGVIGSTVDVRSKVTDASTSFAVSPVIGATSGEKISLLIEDDDAIGTAAFLVIADSSGQVVFKRSLVIGEN